MMRRALPSPVRRAWILVAASCGLLASSTLPAFAWEVHHDGSYADASAYWDADQLHDVATLPGGDIVAGGRIVQYDASFPGNIDADSRMLVVRHEATSGAFVWGTTISVAGVGEFDGIDEIAVGPTGDIFVGGIYNPGSSDDAIVARISAATGAPIWGKGFTVPSPSKLSGSYVTPVVYALETDSSGDVVAALSGSSAGYSFRIVKLDGVAGGDPLWTFDGGATAWYSGVRALAVDSNDDVLVAGSLQCGAACGNGFVVIKIDGVTGLELWRRELGTGATAASSRAAAMVLVDDDAVVAGGSQDVTLARLDSTDGSDVWSLAPATVNDVVSMVLDSPTQLLTVGYDAGGSDLVVTSVDPVDGDVLYAGTEVVCTPSDLRVLPAGVLAVLCGNPFRVEAFSTTDASALWSTTVSDGTRGSALGATLDGDIVAAGRTQVLQGVPRNRGTIARLSTLDGGTADCGNGALESGEQCDDGNVADGDCCASTCDFETVASPCSDGQACSTGDQCDGAGQCTADTSGCTCGNSVLEPGFGEECDDGNVLDGDCCSSTCTSAAAGAPCEDGSVDTVNDVCNGTGFCTAGDSTADCCTDHFSPGCGESACEACVCDLEPLCCSSIWFGPVCAAAALGACADSCLTCTCGNGLRQGAEVCDDGNNVAGDCCAPGCTLEPECGDAMKCYKSKTAKDTPKFEVESVTLADRFQAATPLSVTKPQSLCLPVTVDGQNPTDPAAHLECYRVKDTADAGAVELAAHTGIGTFGVEVGKVASVCAPTSRDGVPTSTSGDSLRCYKAKATATTTTTERTLEDAFETKETSVQKPALLCTAAAADSMSIAQPERHLLCFKIKDAKTDPKQPKFVPTNAITQNVFGSETLTASKGAWVCLPAVTTP